VATTNKIAVVFQDFCRFSLTVGENIALGNLTAIDKLDHLKLAATKAGIAEKIDRLEHQYQTLLGKQFDGTELSGGEWQKIAITLRVPYGSPGLLSVKNKRSY
jgi:ATP-binding cassette subfamily B protein